VDRARRSFRNPAPAQTLEQIGLHVPTPRASASAISQKGASPGSMRSPSPANAAPILQWLLSVGQDRLEFLG
jgi:hypothetical protein